MNFAEAITLAVVQAITEFLPVSSSGHLAVMQYVFGFHEPLVAFDVLLHLGSLVAVLAYFRREIWNLIVSVFAPRSAPGGRRLIGLIIVASIPTGLIGYGFKDFVESQFSSPMAVALFWILTAGLLFGISQIRTGTKTVAELTIWDALLIGLFQGIAVLPGVSRAGATIVMGVMCGMHPKEAAKFSFLIFIPTVLGASVLEIHKLTGIGGQEMGIYLVAAVVAAVLSYVAIWFLLQLLQRRVIQPFAWYCLGAGMITMLALASKV